MIEVVEPGALTTVQDCRGRTSWRRLGVPVGGAADPWNARLAAALVGNREGDGLLEMTLVGPTLRFTEAAMVAVTGGLGATVEGLPLASNAARTVRAGAVLRVGSTGGARGYLAVAGGVDVPAVLGSVATDLRSAFGGHEGRALAVGDRLHLHPAERRGRRWTGEWETGPIRIVPGPHADRLAPDELAAVEWRAGADSDRAGIRLDGTALRGGEAPSMGLPLGAIQVPPGGRPIVMLADRPVTGGYLVPACVIAADVGRVAQLRPGQAVRFAWVSLEEARSALRRAEEELAALEALEAPLDDELGWAGSHG